MKIYISSSLEDLAEHRRAVCKAIESVYVGENVPMDVVKPEALASAGQPPLSLLMSELEESELFVLLLGWRYGYVPEGETRSLAEIEYDTVRGAMQTILCFFADDTHPVEPRFVETGVNAAKLRRFKERVAQEQIVRTFGSPDDLARQMAAAIDILMNTLVGKVGQHLVDRPETERLLRLCLADKTRYAATISELRGQLSSLVPANPIWRARHFETDNTTAFCLLPLRDEFVRVYEQGVLPALEEVGLRGVHAGQIFDNREIMEDIWESICTCRLVVADVTGRNPNVFYELGICHTLGKEVVVLTQRPDDVPFDIRHRRFIAYHPQKMTSLKSELRLTMQRVLVRLDETPAPP